MKSKVLILEDREIEWALNALDVCERLMSAVSESGEANITFDGRVFKEKLKDALKEGEFEQYGTTWPRSMASCAFPDLPLGLEVMVVPVQQVRKSNDELKEE